MNRCTKCIRPEECRGIRFDSEGVCNYCRRFEKKWKRAIDSPDEYFAECQKKLERLITKEKRRNKKYQALLGISGGKDSAYALYLAKKLYGINVLTYTMASEFHRDEARANIAAIVKAFDVDHIYTKGSSPEMFAHSLRKTGRLCYTCPLGSVQHFVSLAKEHDIRILLSGYSPMTDGMDPEGTSPWFVRRYARESENPIVREEGQDLYKGSLRFIINRLMGKLKLFDLGAYFPWDDDEIRVLFREKYNIEFGNEHSDCGLHELAGLCAVKKYGFTLNMSKYCKLILLGRMTREEALEKIEHENQLLLNPTGWEKESIDSTLARISVTPQELEQCFGVDDSRFKSGLLDRLVDYYRTNFYA